MLKGKKKKVYVAKSGDTGEKRKPYQRISIISIYCFNNLQRKDAGSHCFATFFNNPRLSIECGSIFLVRKIYCF